MTEKESSQRIPRLREIVTKQAQEKGSLEEAFRDLQLLLIDLDGTLLNDQKLLDPFTMRVLEENWQTEELGIGLCTGRSSAALKEIFSFFQNRPKDWHIISSGAVIVNSTGEILKKWMLVAQLVEELVRKVVELKGGVAFIYEDTLYCDPVTLAERKEVFPGINYKVISEVKNWETPSLIINNLNQQVETFLEGIADKGLFELKKNAGNFGDYFEITPKGINKASAAKYLAKYLKIPLLEIGAVGDSRNDLEVLEKVGVGIAMKNALPEVKEVAGWQLDLSNQESGVARLIQAINLEKERKL